jgi:hypothetical protein
MPRPPKEYKNGDKFNNLTIIEELDRYITPNGSIKRMFKCVCICGNIKIYDLQTLKKIRSCGCIGLRKNFKPEKGNRYGRLTILEEMDKKHGNRVVKSLCDCGNIVVTALCSLKAKKGGTKSCGCLQKEKSKENAILRFPNPIRNLPEYPTWKRMVRLSKLKCPYYNFGQSTIDKNWEKNINHFILDMGNKPSPQHSLMRISQDPEFNKLNCKWVTNEERGNILKSMGVKYCKETINI